MTDNRPTNGTQFTSFMQQINFGHVRRDGAEPRFDSDIACGVNQTQESGSLTLQNYGLQLVQIPGFDETPYRGSVAADG